MSGDGDDNKWMTPQVLFMALGMLASIGGAWMAFDSRITRTEAGYTANAARLDRIEDKLDRLIENSQRDK